jgi:two-component system sensor kinase FixL
MKDYSRLSKADLIKRLKSVESTATHASQRGLAVAQRLADASEKGSEQRLRAILETAVEAIITIDERGIMESINPAGERIFGYESAELVGRNVSLLMPSPYREQHDGYLASYRRTGNAKIIGIGREVVGRRKDGTVFPMDLSVSEVRLPTKRLFTGFVRDITDQKRLEEEILRISELEQRRIGQDLHDGICQHLAAIELMSQVLEQNLSRKSHPEAAQAGRIAEHVRQSIAQTRMLAHGLSPVELEANGLASALQELAANTENLFPVGCRFRSDLPVLIHDNVAATHLYRIAQEAVSNAIKHGKANQIEICLTASNQKISLAVRDDGVGFPKKPAKKKGMGLRIMQYRAGMIGGSLVIQKEPKGGTTVACSIQNQAAPWATKS